MVKSMSEQKKQLFILDACGMAKKEYFLLNVTHNSSLYTQKLFWNQLSPQQCVSTSESCHLIKTIASLQQLVFSRNCHPRQNRSQHSSSVSRLSVH